MKARIYNDTLNPNIWNPDNSIKPEIRETLLRIAQDFYLESELQAPIEDVYILGSAANYNWGPSSDVDLHVLIDFTKLLLIKNWLRSWWIILRPIGTKTTM